MGQLTGPRRQMLPDTEQNHWHSPKATQPPGLLGPLLPSQSTERFIGGLLISGGIQSFYEGFKGASDSQELTSTLIIKQSKQKPEVWGWGHAQGVNHMPCKLEDLSSDLQSPHTVERTSLRHIEIRGGEPLGAFRPAWHL